MTNNSTVLPVPKGCVSKEALQPLPWDNEDNLVPKHVDNMISLVFSATCVPLLFCVSFSTNIINMIVFWKHGLQERINACLFTLSLVDLMSISVVFGVSCDRLYMFIIGKEEEVGPATQFIVQNYLTGLLGMTTSSQMVYSFIAVERCLCVTRPLLVKRFMSTRTTMILLWTLVFLITGTSAFVLGVQYGVLCLFDPKDQTVSHMMYPRDLYFRLKGVVDVIHSTVMGFVFSGFCLCCVVSCTIVTAIKLRQLSQWRKSVSSASDSVSSRDMAIARVIIGTSILFTVCIVPTLLKYVSLMFVPDIGLGGRYENMGWIFKRLYELCTSINNTFNFFVYYTFGSKFRETVHSMFPCCCRGRLTQTKQ